MPYFWYDSTYILVIIAFFLSMFASFGVKATYAKYSKVRNHSAMTGSMAARKILDMNGLYQVRIERVSGNLTDHYDPKANVIRLSESVYDSDSVAAIGVAAHETGHAIQHNVGYFPIKLRNAVLPVANIGANAAMPLAILGFIMGLPMLVNIGIVLFSAVVLFQLVTLPVEFNASARALSILKNGYILTEVELNGAKKVLTAAALTYVAAMLTSLMSLIRLILLSRNRD